MKCVKFLGVLIFLLQSVFSEGQNLNHSDVKFFSVDALGNIYIVHKNNQLVKFDPAGIQLFSYTNSMSQSLTNLDCSNPLQTLLFFRDLGKIQFLDKNLAEMASPVELLNLSYSDVSAVCSSYNSGLWLYESSEKQLIRLNSSLQITNKSIRLDQIIQSGFEIHKMLEYSDKLLVMDSLHGIFVFDIYGVYKKPVFLGKVADFQLIDENIFYATTYGIIKTDISVFEEQMYFKPSNPVRSFYISTNNVWILNQNQELIKFMLP